MAVENQQPAISNRPTTAAMMADSRADTAIGLGRPVQLLRCLIAGPFRTQPFYGRAMLLSAILFAATAAGWRTFFYLAGPRIRLAPPSVSLGTVQAGDKIDVEVTVENRGRLPLTVYELVRDCSCWRSARMDRWAVPASGKLPLRATLDFTGMRGAVSKSLLIHSNAVGQSLHELRVEGFVRSAIGLSAPALRVSGSGGESILTVLTGEGAKTHRLLGCRARPTNSCRAAIVEIHPGKYEVRVNWKGQIHSASTEPMGTLEIGVFRVLSGCVGLRPMGFSEAWQG